MRVARALSTALVATTLALTAGCTSDGARATSGPAPMSSAAEAPTPIATVFLRAARPDREAPSRVVVDVVAKGVAELHGAAFRVTWPPEGLAFVGAESRGPWSSEALALAKEGSPGQLAVVWAEKGDRCIDASGETVLGRIAFDTLGPDGSAIAFKVERSEIVDKTGARVEAKWVGSAIAAR